MSAQKKVLMLGWEFPPLINGGLGIACYGLAKSLGKIADVTLIIPKADPAFVVDKVNLLGLNLLSDTVKTETTHQSIENVTVAYVEESFFPYEDNKEVLRNETFQNKWINKEIDAFNFGMLYDGDVMEKVYRYAHLVCSLAEKMEFDVIHAHDWMTFVAGMELKARFKKPLVVHVHALETDRSGTDNRGGVFQIEKQAMSVADAVIPVSQYTGEAVFMYYGVPRTKIFPVHNGIDPIDTWRAQKGYPEKLVVFLGRVTGQKGPGYFLEIAQKVITDFPDVRFVMAGSGDKLKTLIETGAHKNLGSRFHFTGFLETPQVRDLLAMADVYCMPSVSEPFGLSALEAAQFGVPCVLSKQAGVGEVLRISPKADFWDIETMAEHIVKLLSDAEYYKEVATEQLDDLKTVTWERAAYMVNEVYKDL